MIEKITLSCKNALLFVVTLFLSSHLFSQTTIIHQADFESNTNGWTSAGTNAVRSNATGYSSAWSLRVGGNTTTSNFTSPLFSLADYDKVDFKFFFYSAGFDNYENFYIEYRDTGISAWVIAATFRKGDITFALKTGDFGNGYYLSKTVTLFKTAYTFPVLPTAQFRVRSASSLISEYVYFDKVTISGTIYKAPTIGPGGITNNLDLWLRADKVDGTTLATDGSNVSKWVDNGKGNDAEVVVSGQEPVYRNSAARNMNFNPVVDFENNNATSGPDMSYIMPRDELKGTGGFNSNDMFVVLMPDPTITTSLIPLDTFTSTDPTGETYSEDVTGFGYGSYTQRFNNEYFTYCIGTTTGLNNGYGRSDLSGTTNFNQIGIINVRQDIVNTGMELYLNANPFGTNTSDAADYAQINNTRYWLGRSQFWNGSFDGRIAEVITYSSRKNDTDLTQERNRIQSYLAIKYGITLGVNGTSQDYVDSSGALIWDINTGVPANDVFNYDIAGIGRDDASALNQKQSKSVNTNDDITIGLTAIATTNSANTNTFSSDKDFLVWGNDHGTLNAITPVVVNMSAGIIPALITNVEFVSVGRTWKVAENTTGDIPSCKVSIPTTMLSNTLSPPGSYLMFISDTPNFDPTADYRVMTEIGGNLYTDYDFDGVKYITFGFAPEKLYERSIYFDGVKDYIDMENALNLNPTEFTVSSWIKRGAGSSNKSILSKRDAAYTEGYDFKITSANKLEMSWGNSGAQKITSNTTIPQDIWHHVAVIYGGGSAKLYIDGVLDNTVTLAAPVATNQSFFIAAAGKNTPQAFFEGNIDEVRVWDVALTEGQLRYVMNQEILENTTFVNGKIIPNAITKNEIAAVPWSNLAGYYPMSVYTYTNTNDASGNGHQGALRNLDTVDLQTAPLPYESASDGTWNTPATWLNNAVQDLPNSASIVNASISVDWNIVQTTHDITSGARDITVLGLKNNAGKLTIDGNNASGTGQGLRVTHYLELDGTIDLEGESQLIQDPGSILDADSGGDLERDQQGTANSFNYNYWSSSVGPKALTGTSTRGTGLPSANAPFTIKGILNDGRAATPPSIVYNTSAYAADSGSGPTLTISSYWLYQFYGKDDDYNSWFPRINENYALAPGVGYTMKGSSGIVPITNQQNYVFRGKPYNGDFTLPLIKGTGYVPANPTGEVDRLIGNPYPSAIDANEFIKDNLSAANGGTNTNNIFNGALYFWDHFGEENSHILKAYVGGYATRNLTGGAPAISNDSRINNNLAAGTKIPQQFIPVGQGFFVSTAVDAVLTGIATVTGGDIVFKNSQRAFKKETSVESVFMKAAKIKNENIQKIEEGTNAHPIIRLMYDSPTGYHRQIVMGKVENTSNHFDLGYDAPIADINKEDMYWAFDGAKFVIQGVPNFDENQEFPLAVKISKTGLARIKIDELESMDENISIYIKDNLLGKTHNISQKPFEIELEAGTYNDRFAVIFKMHKLIEDDVAVAITEETQLLMAGIQVFMDNAIGELQIKNTGDTGITSMALYNYLGQTIKIWSENLNRRTVSLPINATTGVYLLQINTKTGALNTKIIIE